MNGNLSATGAVSGSSFQIGSNLFAFGSYGNRNAFLGFAGNASVTGAANTATGEFVLASLTTGSDNTASGEGALVSNSTGSGNTAIGEASLQNNTTANYNTALGVFTLAGLGTGDGNTEVGARYSDTLFSGSQNTFVGFHSGAGGNATLNNVTAIGANAAVGLGTNSFSNATAIGANAQVAASNAMVLGSINGVNGATADTNVGIGTTAPVARLHIGPANSLGLRVEGPNTVGTGAYLASFGGFGDFNIDAPGIVGGRFSVRENGQVTIGGTGPVRILTVAGGLGHPIADGWDSYSSRR